jgi:hypothetical protein
MALDNSLYIKLSKDTDEIKSWMIDNLDYHISDDLNTLSKRGVIAIVDRYKPHYNVVEETYGFLPNISIYFRRDKFEAYEDGYENMVRSVISILRNFHSEAILLGPGGETLLLYKNDDLILQKKGWGESGLSLIDSPYTLQEITNM